MTENFKLIAKDGIMLATAMALELEKWPNEWNRWTARETTSGSPHSGTQSAYLRFCPWPVNLPADATDMLQTVAWPLLQFSTNLQNALAQLYKALPEGQGFGRVLFARLAPGASIIPHADSGRYAEATQRFHFVVDSNPETYLQVGEGEEAECCVMRPGELWWFNNRKVHTRVNEGTSPSIHLIVDTFRGLMA